MKPGAALWTCVVCLSAMALAGVSVGAQKVDWKKVLKTQIEAKYPKAKLSWDGKNIKQPGEPLILMQPHVLAETRAFWNYFKNGQLQSRGAGGFMSDLVRQSQDDQATRDRVSLPLYQPIFLTDVGVSNDQLRLFVATERQFIQESVDRAAIMRFVQGASLKGDTLTKADVAARQAGLVLQFPRGALERMTFDEVVSEIDKVLLRMDDPKAPKFGTVALGMTREEVITNLGKTVNVINLGSKEILVYPRIKVTLEDGKVTSVE